MTDLDYTEAGRFERARKGFWQVFHEDLVAFLARSDLSWGRARTYLALGDLTRGYGKKRAVVSLSQIACRSGKFVSTPDRTKRPDRAHVARDLKWLEKRGLAGSRRISGQQVERWITWPPPPLHDEGTGAARSGSTIGPGDAATTGSGPAASSGNTSSAKDGSASVAETGSHQDVKNQNTRARRFARSALTGCPTDLGETDRATHRQLHDLYAKWDAAYREVFDCGMPVPWREQIAKEVQADNTDLLANMTPDVIRAGRRRAEKKGGTFGFGWVRHVLADNAAAELAQKKRRSAQAEREQREEQKRQADRAQKDRRLAYFARVAPERQAEFREKARQLLSRRSNTSPEDVEVVAARLAFDQDYPEAAS